MLEERINRAISGESGAGRRNVRNNVSVSWLVDPDSNVEQLILAILCSKPLVMPNVA